MDAQHFDHVMTSFYHQKENKQTEKKRKKRRKKTDINLFSNNNGLGATKTHLIYIYIYIGIVSEGNFSKFATIACFSSVVPSRFRKQKNPCCTSDESMLNL